MGDGTMKYHMAPHCSVIDKPQPADSLQSQRADCWYARHAHWLVGARPIQTCQQELLAKGKGSIARWNLKEARSKIPV